MEFILVLVAFAAVGYWAFNANKKRKEDEVVVPYKVETPPVEVGKSADDRVETPAPVEVPVEAPVVVTAPAKAPAKPKLVTRTAKPKAPAKAPTKVPAKAPAKAPAKPRVSKAKPQA